MNNSTNLTDSSDGEQSCRKGWKVSAKSGSLSIVCIQLGPWKLAIIWSREVAAKQGFLNGNTVRTKVSVRYRQGGRKSAVAVKRGSTIPIFPCFQSLGTHTHKVSLPWLCSHEKKYQACTTSLFRFRSGGACMEMKLLVLNFLSPIHNLDCYIPLFFMLAGLYITFSN